MTPLLSIILLFLLAYAGYSLYQRFGLNTFWLKLLVDSGGFHLLLGVLVGPHFFSLITQEILIQLNFLVALVLGWAGFLIGLQVKKTELQRFQKSYYLFSAAFFISTAALLTIILFGFDLLGILKYDISQIAFLALLGAVSSPILIGWMKRDFKFRGTTMHLFQFSVALDNVFSIVLLGLFVIIINPYFGFDIDSILVIAGVMLFSSAMAWFLFKILKDIRNEQQYFLLLIGFLLITTGVSINLGLSTLFVAFIFGVVLANLPISTKRLYHNIANAEKPLYYLLVIFTGASIGNVNLHFILIALLFVVVRFTCKLFAGYFARQVIIEKKLIPLNNGLAHIGMGGVSLAMVLDYHLSVGSALSELFILIAAIAVILNSLLASQLISRIKV